MYLACREKHCGSRNSQLLVEFIIINLSERGRPMTKWSCTACGYVYDPAEGDPEQGVAPGTAFEDLPEDWVCPNCGLGKDNFEPL